MILKTNGDIEMSWDEYVKMEEHLELKKSKQCFSTNHVFDTLSDVCRILFGKLVNEYGNENYHVMYLKLKDMANEKPKRCFYKIKDNRIYVSEEAYQRIRQFMEERRKQHDI